MSPLLATPPTSVDRSGRNGQYSQGCPSRATLDPAETALPPSRTTQSWQLDERSFPALGMPHLCRLLGASGKDGWRLTRCSRSLGDVQGMVHQTGTLLIRQSMTRNVTKRKRRITTSTYDGTLANASGLRKNSHMSVAPPLHAADFIAFLAGVDGCPCQARRRHKCRQRTHECSHPGAPGKVCDENER